MKTIILDPGHGLGNKRAGTFDPGAVSSGVHEADIVMDWANELRGILMRAGHRVVRTRVDHSDPAPIRKRASIAKQFGGEIMLSLHCNAANGKASGTEVFYRGADDKAMAVKLSAAVSTSLGIRNRGAKTESQSQHSSLAVLEFDKCWLIEIGFIDNASDRAKMLDPVLRQKACEAIAEIISAC